MAGGVRFRAGQSGKNSGNVRSADEKIGRKAAEESRHSPTMDIALQEPLQPQFKLAFGRFLRLRGGSALEFAQEAVEGDDADSEFRGLFKLCPPETILPTRRN